MEFNEKFCPICKNKNKRMANVCVYCGAPLMEYHCSNALSTAINTKSLEKISANIIDLPIDRSVIPDNGIAIYVADTLKPIYLGLDEKLVFGRKGDERPEANLFDLSELGGYQAGISRQHAMICRTEAGYEIIDLGSTNGSWLNDARLVPHKPVPLASESQLRLGRLQFFVIYHPVSKRKVSGQLA